MKSSNVRPILIQHFLDHPNQILMVETIAAENGLTPGQVRNGVRNLRVSSDEFHNDIEVLAAGHTWRYNPGVHQAVAAAQEQQGGVLYEEIGRTKSGAVLVQDEEGAVYKLTEIDI